jgi:hypothetical protein
VTLQDIDLKYVQGVLTTNKSVRINGNLTVTGDIAGAATDAELAAHEADTTNVHGIPDTAALETQSGAQAKADAGRDAAIADAATKYLNRTTGGTVTGDVTFSGLVQLARASATAVGVGSQVTGDGLDSFRILARGQMEWGSGAGARDAFLARESAGVMAWTDTIQRIYRATAGSNAMATRVTGDTVSRWFVNADGAQWWGTGAATVDVGLWRSAAGQLTTGGALQTLRNATTDAVRDVRLNGDAQPRFYQVASGQMYWGPGTGTLDTLLYRDAPGSLVTDGNYTVNGTLFAGNLSATGIGQKLFARRTSDLTRTNNNTRSNDTQLVLNLSPNSVYQVHGLIIWGGSAAGDISLAFSAPSGATGWWSTVAPATSVAADPTSVRIPANTITQFRTYGWFDNGSPNASLITAVVVTGATGGTYAVSWAQNAADATGTTVYANSFLSAERVA